MSSIRGSQGNQVGWTHILTHTHKTYTKLHIQTHSQIQIHPRTASNSIILLKILGTGPFLCAHTHIHTHKIKQQSYTRSSARISLEKKRRFQVHSAKSSMISHVLPFIVHFFVVAVFCYLYKNPILLCQIRSSY